MKYYVYGHYNTVDDQLFYIGKGSGKRLNNLENRSKLWKTYTSNHPWYSKIIVDNLSESEAFKIEKELIYKNKESIINISVNSETKIIPDFSSLFYYNPLSPSGLSWLVDNVGNNGRIYNKKDTPVGSIRDGHRSVWKIVVNNEKYYVHRIIYSLYNKLPCDMVVDHLDGNTLNNKLENLCLKTQKENTRNCKKPSNSGKLTGVSFRSRVKKGKEHLTYSAYVYTLQGKLKTKTFSISKYGEEEAFRLACEWRKEQIEQLNANGAGYTERHGT